MTADSSLVPHVGQWVGHSCSVMAATVPTASKVSAMPSLTLAESRRRASLLSVGSYDVTLDLTGDDRVFGSATTVMFTAHDRGDTWLDVAATRLTRVTLDGAPLDIAALRDARLPLSLTAGEHEIFVEAEMAYRHDGEGLHRAVDPADGLHYAYAMSFLDAAPSIFACFDQPDLKAPYTVHVAAPEDWVVVGNGRAEQVAPGRWELATTPPLPTYLVTVVAGPYHVVSDEHDGIRLGLECRRSLAPHLDADADELLTVTKQCFDEYHRLFGVRYPFGDYHQAFVPEFNAGAMENPGCVTFRDPMVFASKVTRAERMVRASVIAHEMAHMWFGDLVTMKWWDDLWLNESFAEYMAKRVTEDATDFEGVWVDDGYTRRPWGLRADQRASTHPVAANGAPDAASALQDFDGISYAKGAAVLKQLHTRYGDDVFYAGVREHFARHRFGNATMADLFTAWRDAGATDLDGWAAPWLQVAGVDLISLDRGGGRVLRQTPEQHPADRTHVLALATYDGRDWNTTPLTVDAEVTALPAIDARPVVIDPSEETWARTGLDDVTLTELPRLLPSIPDPLMRSAVWNAVRDGVTNATLDPQTALRLIEETLPTEAEDVAVRTVGSFALSQLVPRLLSDSQAARARIGAAARTRLETAAPGSDLQLAAIRVVVEASSDAAELTRWVGGADVPNGVVVDLDLRWKMLVRLAELDAVDPAELDRWVAHETTAEATSQRVRCRASYPTEAAKSYAWRLFTGSEPGSIYEIQAAASGMWQRGQESLTAEYVDRFFTDAPKTEAVRAGYLLADVAERFFPWIAVEPRTLAAAQQLADDTALDPGLRRAIADAADDLRHDLAVRERFWGE